jgi:concanavalin A-like lectin/glucanase superfamily protein
VKPKLKQTATLLGTFALVVCCNASAQIFLTNGLVAYYPFSGNANDETGNGNNGEVHGARLVPDRFGHPNAAYAFNGYNSFILLTNSFNLPGDFTVTAWASANTLGQESFVFHVGTDGGTNFTELPKGGNGFGVACNSGWLYDVNDEACFWIGDRIPATNTWFYVAMRLGGQYSGISLNGSGFGGAGCTPISPVQGFIGAGSQKSSFFNGTVDDVRVYNRALTDLEIQQLYAYEAGPAVTLQKAVRPGFSNLVLGTNYQLQVSADLTNWTNQGAPFTATNTAILSQQYFDVDVFGGLFFRLQTAP